MAREKPPEPIDEGDPNAWMATFSDLVTLLITFFVLLLSMSSLDAKVLEETVGFFNGRLGALGTTTEAGAMLSTSLDVPEAPIMPSIREVNGEPHDNFNFEANREDVLDDGEESRKRMDMSSNLHKALEEARQKGAAQQVDALMPYGTGSTTREKFRAVADVLRQPRYRDLFRVRVADDKLRIQLVGDLLFIPGRVRIRPESLVLLKELSELARDMKVDSKVLGVVPKNDAKPIRVDLYPTGWDLAIARACNVVRYMANRGDVPPAMLSCSVLPSKAAGEASASGVIFEMRVPQR